MTNEIITREIDELALSLGIPRMDFVLIISDAASHLVKSYQTLKILFPQLFRYTCMSHLVHNCCLRIKENFKLTDKLIDTTKAFSNKNITRRLAFASIGIPPTPVITRWGTWLKAVEYYYNNFNQVKSIILAIESEGEILSDCKRAIQNNDLEAELQIIKKCYIPLITVIEDLIEKRYTITQSYHLLKNFDFKEDPIMIKTYLLKRLDAHGINDVFKKKNTLGFVLYNNLLVAQSTSIDVERSFSILGKILRDNRHFNDNNICDYIIAYYNNTDSQRTATDRDIIDDTDDIITDS